MTSRISPPSATSMPPACLQRPVVALRTPHCELRAAAPLRHPRSHAPCHASGALSIRPAHAGDVDSIALLLRDCGSSWGSRQIAEEITRPIALTLVAFEEPPEALQGVVVAWRVAGDCHVLELAVRPCARRRGIASTLLEKAVSEACGPEGSTLLEVRESNAGARALYARCGFAEVGRRPRYYPDKEAAILCTRPPKTQLSSD